MRSVLALLLVLPSSHATPSACAAFDATTRTDPVLGKGISLTTPFTGNLVPAGQQPMMTLTGAPQGATLTWTITRRSTQVATGRTSTSSTPTSIALPSKGPGAYQVEAQLNGASTCLRYGVAMPGATLDLDNLPAGRDWGGPAPQREVVLQSELGGNLVRRGVSYGSDPRSYDFTAAAQQAQRSGMKLDVQVGQGGAAEYAAVANGTWEAGVRAIVQAHPEVPYWEAWNEPNFHLFYTGTATDYVNKILKPFARAVHDANPSAKVVGGSTYGVDLDWWKEFGKAGGFQQVDVVAVHAYEWDSGWEHTWMLSTLKSLKVMAHGKPIWDTESGYRSLSEAGGPWLQADFAVRKVLWLRSLGIPTQTFLIEGGWEDWAVIDQYRGVKPAAMALSTYDTLLRGRPFVGMVTTKKGVYAARFGAAKPGGDGIVAVWTAGDVRTLPLRTKHSGYDETGGALTTGRALKVGGSVQYLTFKAGGAVL